MIIPDSNLLLHADNIASPYHAGAREWWEKCLSADERVGLVYPVIFAFLRISTSAKIFPMPLTLTKASKHISTWLGRDVVRILPEGPDHVAQVVRLLEGAGSTGGNLVTDAQIAAIAMAQGDRAHGRSRFHAFSWFELPLPAR